MSTGPGLLWEQSEGANIPGTAEGPQTQFKASSSAELSGKASPGDGVYPFSKA